MVSIDGNTTPEPYKQAILPWMLQSPVFPTIGLLMASSIRSMISGDVATAQDKALVQARVFSLMHKYIQSTTSVEWAEELLGCSINLILFEVCSVSSGRAVRQAQCADLQSLINILAVALGRRRVSEDTYERCPGYRSSPWRVSEPCPLAQRCGEICRTDPVSKKVLESLK